MKNTFIGNIKEFLFNQLDLYLYIFKEFYDMMYEFFEEKRIFLVIVLILIFPIILNPIILFPFIFLFGIYNEIDTYIYIKKYKKKQK